jgi:hypothetical protein
VGLDAARRREAEWKETESRWEAAPTSRSTGDLARYSVGRV